jgi:hypothetical protein
VSTSVKEAKMSSNLNSILDGTADAWEELTSTRTKRTGYAAARVASALAHNVDAEVLALQMTKNSKKNSPDSPITFTADDMLAIAKLHAASKTRTALPKKQTSALISQTRPEKPVAVHV